ncbi:beta-ketoacyl-ACP synthase 3 [Longispora sp. NPDC051575]|uniref:beta-ketoacyl-ACP synthase 3 n=1 Tax=Longispora sp. NPDC051575 TaxID=3154943 RepID=UPI003423EB6D
MRPGTRTGHAQLLGVGGYRPDKTVTNAEAAARCGVTEAWISSRTGILERRIAGPQETLAAMAISAARAALDRTGVDPADVGCVLVASMSHTRQVPPLAPDVAYRLGATTAVAYDVSVACSGFCYALAQAADHVRSGSTRYALVIGAERMSDITDPADPGTGPLFADGAGAVLIGPADTPGIGPVTWGADGGRDQTITMTSTWAQAQANRAGPPPAVTMDGGRVWSWIRSQVVDAIGRTLSQSGVSFDDVAVFVPHQANGRIIDMLVERLHLPDHVLVARDITHSGNTSAASIPLALDRLYTERRARTGDLALLFGFGAGLAYAGQLVTLP